MACAIEDLGQQALDGMPASLRELPQDLVPLRAFDTVGLPALRALLVPGAGPVAPAHDTGKRCRACRSRDWLHWPTNWPRPGTA